MYFSRTRLKSLFFFVQRMQCRPHTCFSSISKTTKWQKYTVSSLSIASLTNNDYNTDAKERKEKTRIFFLFYTNSISGSEQ